MNIPYRASNWLGNRNRKRFAETFHLLPPVKTAGPVATDVYSFSGQRDYLEQTASIRTFLQFVGVPKHFRVISDGSHTEETRRHLESIHPCVQVVPINLTPNKPVPSALAEYARNLPLGKKLLAIYGLEIAGPSIYADSDILFFPNGGKLRDFLKHPPAEPHYMLDCWPSVDIRLVRSEDEKSEPVNSGFFYWSSPLDWTDAISRFDAISGEPDFFTEQTTIHFAIKASGGRPLPPESYVLQADDQFRFTDRWAKREIVLRHYISSIRTKFWHHTALFSE